MRYMRGHFIVTAPDIEPGDRASRDPDQWVARWSIRAATHADPGEEVPAKQKD
jgi:hypothetical protein